MLIRTSSVRCGILTAALKHFVPGASLETEQLRKLVSNLSSQESSTALKTTTHANSTDCIVHSYALGKRWHGGDACTPDQSGTPCNLPTLGLDNPLFSNVDDVPSDDPFPPLPMGKENDPIQFPMEDFQTNYSVVESCSPANELSPSLSTTTDVDETIVVRETASTSRK